MVNATPQLRRGTIRFYNGDGTVRVAVDERRLGEQKLEYNVDIPLAWAGPKGELMGGFPTAGAPVVPPAVSPSIHRAGKCPFPS